MSLGKDELVHIHKVLHSDREECALLAADTTGSRLKRMQARREEDGRILKLIEEELGYIPVWDCISYVEEKVEE